jgi:uncharacterized protein YecE (DUF72 family)
MPSASPFENGEAAALDRALPPRIMFGTSSWTFPGWAPLIYGGTYPARQPSVPLLRQYARVPLLRTVGIDSTYYAPATPETLRAYADALPPHFRCVMKAWNSITTHTWSRAQDPQKRGGANPHFLDVDLFLEAVWRPVHEHFAAHTGALVLEFPALPLRVIRPGEFAARLDTFLARVPRDLPLQVEVRNEELLTPSYLAVLRTHGVGHCFNHWARMPTIGAQLDLAEVVTGEALVARLMLGQGKEYETMKEAYAPFDRVVDRNPALRRDVQRLVAWALQLALPCYIIVNNKVEGSAPLTILEMVREIVGVREAMRG